jgi:hypothetical protein
MSNPIVKKFIGVIGSRGDAEAIKGKLALSDFWQAQAKITSW